RAALLRSVVVFFVVCHAEDGIRVRNVTGVQTCAHPVYLFSVSPAGMPARVRGTVTFAAENFEIATSDLGVAAFTITPRAGMQYIMQYRLADEQGRSVQSAQTWSCDQSADNFLMRADQATFTGGDTLHLIV